MTSTAYFQRNLAALRWLSAGLVMTTLLHVPHLPPAITGIFFGLVLGRWGMVRFGSGVRMNPPSTSARLVRFLLISVVMIVVLTLIYFSYGRWFSREPGVALLTAVVALKLWEIASERDFHVTVLTGYFHTATLFFYYQSMGATLYVLLTIVAITTSLILCHDYGGRRASREGLRLSAVLLLQALPFALVAFVLFPRLPGPLWGLAESVRTGITGVGETMAPGTISSLIQSNAIAFRVDFYGPEPSTAQLYWRGPVLWETDGTTWKQGDSKAQRYDGFARQGAATAYAITMEPHRGRWLFALDLPVRAPQGTRITPDLQLVHVRPVQARVRHELTSYVDYRIVPENPRRLQRGLQLPPDRHLRTVSLGRSWREQGLAASEIVNRALQTFRTGGYVYTLQPRAPPLQADLMDGFLFDTRQGFCEHYASAFVLLMRAAGIPARVVTGYQGGEFNPVGGYYTVRQKDAHAWTEVWLPEEGWRRVDPTAVVAPNRLELGVDDFLPVANELFIIGSGTHFSEWWRTARFSLDALNNRWNQWILAYDRQRQLKLLQNMGMQRLDISGLLLAALKWFALLLLLFIPWMLRRSPGRAEPVVELYRQFCLKLARAGLPRRPVQGPLDFADSIAGRLTRSCRQEVERITELYVRYRYGSAPDGLQELKSRIRAFRPRIQPQARETV